MEDHLGDMITTSRGSQGQISEAVVSNENFVPRQYQVELLEAALDHNTIVCLQTGTGKTFIGVMLIKELAEEIRKNYSQGGKRTVFLVNTVPLVSQQANVIKMHTDLSVGEYVGAMKVDIWDGRKWEQEFQKHQVLVMTAQIFLDILHHGFMGLSQVNLLIFDECHHAVKSHPYREIMKMFDTCRRDEYPRVLGLTASILSSKCSPQDFEENMIGLEKTMRCAAETTGDLASMKMYGTKPDEKILKFPPYDNDSDVYCDLWTILFEAELFIRECQLPFADEAKDPRTKAKQVINDCIHVLTTIGPLAFKLFIPYCIADLDKDLDVEFLEWPTTFLQYAKTQLRMALKICEFAGVKVLDFDGWRSTDMITPKLKTFLQVLEDFKPSGNMAEPANGLDTTSLCGVVFVERRCTAVILDHLLKEIQKRDPDLSFISSSIVVGAGGMFAMGEEQMRREYKKQEAELKKFRKHDINLLFATSVLEEGVDVPMLNLVVRYDLPKLYGSYIQSRGRARAPQSQYIMLVDREQDAHFDVDLYNFREIEKILQTKCHNREHHDDDDISVDMADNLIPPYMPRVADGAPRVTLAAAIPLVHRYCSKLPSDRYTHLAPRLKTIPMDLGGEILYQSVMTLPSNCPIKEPIYGHPMPKRKLSEMSAALETCIRLHKAGELDDHLLPVSHKVNTKYEDELEDEEDDDVTMVIDGCGKPGTTKRRQLYKKMISSHLKDTSPQVNTRCYLYKIHMKVAGVCTCDEDKKKYGYHPENIPQCFGVVTKKPIPTIPSFLIYTKTGELCVSLEETMSDLMLSGQERQQLEAFHQCLFEEVLLIGNQSHVVFGMDKAETDYVIAPLQIGIHDRIAQIDWNKVMTVSKTVGSFNHMKHASTTEMLATTHQRIQPMHYKDAVVSPIYRNEDEPQRYFVKYIAYDMTADSVFPDDKSKTFADYYQQQYDITLQHPEQPLLCARHVPLDLNFLSPINEATSGCGASTGRNGWSTKKQKKSTQYLVPELCHVYPLPGSLWCKALFLPTVLHRVNQLLIAEELLIDINQTLSPGIIGQQELKTDSSTILQALTTTRARESFDLERLEMLGDSFLKFSTSCYLFITHSSRNEGYLSAIRSKMVRNSNLYQIGKMKGIPQKMSVTRFEPKTNWLPPGFCSTGYMEEESCTHQWIADKSVADSIEALIGWFLTTHGTIQTLNFMTKWLGITVLPTNDDDNGTTHMQHGYHNHLSYDELEEGEIVDECISMTDYFRSLPPASLSTSDAMEQLNHLTQGFEMFEETIGYRFRNKAYLLQALTHSSYHYNHVTECYQRLEFLGDAILDYLITKHLYHLEDHHQRNRRQLSPGALTDIRSALVCNNMLAHWAVEYDYHKYLKSLSPELFYLIDNFVKTVQEDESDATSSSGSDNESDVEEVEIPKVLGDIVESVAGAIYLDSGLSLDVVWDVYYQIMKEQIELYVSSPPMSPIRELMEKHPGKVTFSKREIDMDNKRVKVSVDVEGVGKFVGSGKNSRSAKMIAAKKALKQLKKFDIDTNKHLQGYSFMFSGAWGQEY